MMGSPNVKQDGSYYTPRRLADYIVYHLFKEGEYSFANSLDVLEPSAGDGIFIDALLNGNYYKEEKGLLSNSDMPHFCIDAVEIDSRVALELGTKTKGYDTELGSVRVHNKDGLEYFLNNDKKYDLIIGNPPYIRRRNMSESTKELCARVHEVANIADGKPKNLWTSFFAGAKMMLKDKGVIAFVLPTDLLQVKYAQVIRDTLYRDFERVEIFALNWIYFDDIEQDVVILMCSNGHGTNHPKFCHIDSLEDLEQPKHYVDYDNSQRSTLNKWTNYLLSSEEFEFLDSIHAKIKPLPVKDYCNSGAGIVTAANDFFIVDKGVVDEYKLEDIALPAIKKSSSMPPSVVLTGDDIRKKTAEGAELFLIHFPDVPKNMLGGNYRSYIEIGENQHLHERYKMLKREHWYAVPSVWRSEAFFTKRSNIFPRIITDKAGVYVTDAFYRIRMKQGMNAGGFATAFHNTFTFIYAELSGRYYGGGVLELTPNEFKDLPVPDIINKISDENLYALDRILREGKGVKDFLDFSDNTVLVESCGLSWVEVKKLREIYLKLLRRRLKKASYDIT